MKIISAFFRSEFCWVVYRAESLPLPDLGELTIEVVGPGQRLNEAQRQFLRLDWSRFMIWYLLRLRCWGTGWVFLAKCGGQYAHYTFVSLGRHYRKELPLMRERKAMLVGPCATREEFRGRSIYPRVLQYAVYVVSRRGYGPFYVNVNTWNAPSIRGIEKAGFVRCGIWAGEKRAASLWARSVRVGD